MILTNRLKPVYIVYVKTVNHILTFCIRLNIEAILKKCKVQQIINKFCIMKNMLFSTKKSFRTH